MSSTLQQKSSSSDTALATAAGIGIGIGMIAGAFLSRYLPAKLVQNSSSSSLASRPPYKPGQKPSLPSESFGNKIIFDPSKLTSAYHLMISSATPRPIALVSSRNPTTGIDNVAPFSYFGCVGHDPPMLAIGFCRNRDGSLKDSISNILASKEFSVQIISEWYLDAANHSCGAFSPETDEYLESGMTKVECQNIQASMVQEAAVVYECRLVHVQATTNQASGKPTTEIVLAQVIQIHVDETVLMPNYDPLKPEVNTTQLKPLGRLGGNLYTRLGEIVDIPRPQVSS